MISWTKELVDIVWHFYDQHTYLFFRSYKWTLYSAYKTEFSFGDVFVLIWYIVGIILVNGCYLNRLVSGIFHRLLNFTVLADNKWRTRKNLAEPEFEPWFPLYIRSTLADYVMKKAL